MDLLQRTGENIRAIRESRGLSQAELAKVAKLHRTYIGAVERGEINLTLETLGQFAIALGVECSILLVERAYRAGKRTKRGVR